MAKIENKQNVKAATPSLNDQECATQCHRTTIYGLAHNGRPQSHRGRRARKLHAGTGNPAAAASSKSIQLKRSPLEIV